MMTITRGTRSLVRYDEVMLQLQALVVNTVLSKHLLRPKLRKFTVDLTTFPSWPAISKTFDKKDIEIVAVKSQDQLRRSDFRYTTAFLNTTVEFDDNIFTAILID